MTLLNEIIERVTKLPVPDQRELVKAALDYTRHLPWVRNPGPQKRALESLADELLYGGAAGGGKTDLLLGTALLNHRQALILRRLNGEVDGMIDRMIEIVGHERGLKRNPPALWRFPDKIIRFGGCQFLPDRRKYQGVPKDFIGFDELANFLEAQYTFIIAWARSTFPGQRVRTIATSNPPTDEEGQWVLQRWAPWLDDKHPYPALDGELRWFTTIDGHDTMVDGPGPVTVDGKVLVDGKGDVIYPTSRTFIRADLTDNDELAETGYGHKLSALPAELRAAMKEGDFSRGLQDDQWQVFPSAWVDAAQARWHEQGYRGTPMHVLGVDIAQGGKDQTVLAARHGSWFAPLKVFPGKDTPDGPTVAGLIFMTMRDGCEVIIDMGGGYGGSTRDHLKQVMNPTLFNGGEGGSGHDRTGALRFANRRAEAAWRLRDALDPEYGAILALPPDQELKADLVAMRWKPTKQGVLLESKEEMKTRTGRSPDRADAVIMAHYARGKTSHEPLAIANLQRKARVSSRRPPRRGR